MSLKSFAVLEEAHSSNAYYLYMNASVSGNAALHIVGNG